MLCRRGTLYPPAAGAAEGSPRLVHRLDALNLLCSRPLRGSLPVLCSRRRHRAVPDSWSRGFQAAVLELELPVAALSPPGRCTAEPPPEGWSALYPYPLLRGSVYTSLSTRRDSVRHGALLSAREGPWCVISSPARLHGLCIWMPKALATELGPRTVASRSCAVPTWHAVPASGWCCRRPCTSPRCFEFCCAQGLCEVACPCFAREGATEPFWSRGHGGTGLQFLNWRCRRQPFHRLAALPLSLHLQGSPRSIPPLYTCERSTRPFLRGATPLATVCHGAPLSAREGPWCVISSPARSLIMDAEGPRDGARCTGGRFAELCCADVARCTRWRCRGQPAPVHRLARL